MLIVCNGAQKGGSTWIYNLVKIIRPAAKIPDAYQEAGYRSSALARDRIADFVAEVDWRRQDYVCKQHWTHRVVARKLANDPDTRFVNIIRDIRDVLVSRYHHDIRRKNVPDTVSFAEYYASRGLEMMQHYCRYQFYWHRDFAASDREPLLMSYEALKTGFQDQVLLLGRFLDVAGADIDMARAHAETDIENLAGLDHYRKGITGDWLAHFTPELAQSFEDHLRDNGYLAFLSALKERGIHVTDDLVQGGWAAICAAAPGSDRTGAGHA